MKIPDEEIPVAFIQTHKCASHYNELNLKESNSHMINKMISSSEHTSFIMINMIITRTLEMNCILLTLSTLWPSCLSCKNNRKLLVADEVQHLSKKGKQGLEIITYFQCYKHSLHYTLLVYIERFSFER